MFSIMWNEISIVKIIIINHDYELKNYKRINVWKN